MDNQDILKTFGFAVESEKKKPQLPEIIEIVTNDGRRYNCNTVCMMKISEYVNNIYTNNNEASINMPPIIDHKFMDFLVDYCVYVEKHGEPAFNQAEIISATVLEHAVPKEIYELFVKHFDYKFRRSDLAVKEYLDTFGHMLECSTAIVANSLITLFAIAHKIIIQRLPSAEFIIMDD